MKITLFFSMYWKGMYRALLRLGQEQLLWRLDIGLLYLIQLE